MSPTNEKGRLAAEIIPEKRKTATRIWGILHVCVRRKATRFLRIEHALHTGLSFLMVEPGPELAAAAPAAAASPVGEGQQNATDAPISGVYGELEDEIPSDLLANLIEVTDKDLKDSVRQDHARRCSKHCQWLVRRLGGAGCHPVDGRPTPLPVKCCPSSKSRKPHPDLLDYSKVGALCNFPDINQEGGKERRDRHDDLGEQWRPTALPRRRSEV